MSRKQTFGQRLAELRDAAGLSRTQLADKTGISRQHVRDLEDDRKAPSWEVVLQLCRALGLRPNDFDTAG